MLWLRGLSRNLPRRGAYSLDGGFEGARSYPESAAVF